MHFRTSEEKIIFICLKKFHHRSKYYYSVFYQLGVFRDISNEGHVISLSFFTWHFRANVTAYIEIVDTIVKDLNLRVRLYMLLWYFPPSYIVYMTQKCVSKKFYDHVNTVSLHTKRIAIKFITLFLKIDVFQWYTS